MTICAFRARLRSSTWRRTRLQQPHERMGEMTMIAEIVTVVAEIVTAEIVIEEIETAEIETAEAAAAAAAVGAAAGAARARRGAVGAVLRRTRRCAGAALDPGHE